MYFIRNTSATFQVFYSITLLPNYKLWLTYDSVRTFTLLNTTSTVGPCSYDILKPNLPELLHTHIHLFLFSLLYKSTSIYMFTNPCYVLSVVHLVRFSMIYYLPLQYIVLASQVIGLYLLYYCICSVLLCARPGRFYLCLTRK